MQLLREFVREAVLTSQHTRQVLAEKKEAFDMAAFEAADDKEEYLDFHAKVLGAGVGRTVYDCGNGTVVKWARNSNGTTQNKREAQLHKCASPDAPVAVVHNVGPKFGWLVADYVEPITGKQLKRALKATVGLDDADHLSYVVEAGTYTGDEWADGKPVHARLYRMNDWYRALFDTVKACKINPMELHADNWGLDGDGNLVLVDAGG